MTSLKQFCHDLSNSDVAKQPEATRQSLRIFDLCSSKKSRIPVLVDKEGAREEKRPCNRQVLETNTSKIPIYKVDARNVDVFSSLRSRMSSINKEAAKSRSSTRDRLSTSSNYTDASTKSRNSLKLHGLELTSLPQDLFDRNDLESLILSPERESCLDFKLPFLPSAVGKLTKLQTLVLDTNELHDIPNEIENLQELETLILGNNNLSYLPEGLSKLNKLKSLHLANNNFEEMPRVICELASLRFLDMSDNKIMKLPKEISQLSGTLQTLLLVVNSIESLPKHFSQLTLLSCLWLGENNLRELPENFGNLFRLDWSRHPCSSNIDGNPLERPPLGICQRGPQEIQRYFNKLKNRTLEPNMKKPLIRRDSAAVQTAR